jgi:hypothetical protein
VLPEDEGFIDWLNWNTYLLPLIWALVIAIHGIRVYRRKFKIFRGWEERKIKELIQKEEENNQRFTSNN